MHGPERGPVPAWETPAAQQAEEATLGSCLIDPKQWPVVAGLLTIDDFSSTHCKDIFQAMGIVASLGEIDPVLVAAALGRTRTPATTLTRIVDATVWSGNAERYAKVVAGMGERRRIDITGRLLSDEARQGLPPDESIDAAVQALQSARRELPAITYIGDAINAYLQMDSVEDLSIPTETKALDALLGGYRRGSLYTIAAATSVGKSAFMLDQSIRQCEAGRRCGFISLELTELELAERILSRFTRMSTKTLLDLVAVQASMIPTDDDRQKALSEAFNQISRLQFHVSVSPTNSVQSVMALAERMRDELSLDFICVDYLQLLTAGERNRVTDLEIVTRMLKALSIRLDIPIMVGAQVNRNVDIRDMKGERIHVRPQLSHLRGSGSIEQDSDVVLIMWKDKDDASNRHIHVAKNRQGATGQVTMEFVREFGHFQEVEF